MLGARAHALATRLQQDASERVVLLQVGVEALADDLDAPDDPQSVAQRLYDAAAIQ